MTRLTLGEGKVTADCANATRVMRGMKKLAARNKGDLSSAVISAGHHARKQNQIMYVYLGNSYGHLVWNVASKASDYLSPINNIGRTVLSVAPDLACLEYAVLRDGQPAPEEETEMHENAKLPKGIREVRGESSQVRKGQIADVPRSREYEDADWPWIRKNAKGTLYIEVRPSKGNDWVEALDGTYDAGSIREARKYAIGLLQSGEADAVTIKGWGPRWSSRGGTDQAILYEFGEYELGSAYDIETVQRIDVLIHSLGEHDHRGEVELMSGVPESRYFQGAARAVTESDLRDVMYKLQAQKRFAEERGSGYEENSGSDYIQAKERRDQLEAAVQLTGRALRELSGGGPMGMTPESVRATPKWRAAKREADAAMAALQAFNTVFVRRFKKEIAEDRKRRYETGHHEPNAGSYYVWVIGSNNQPLDEGPFGPHDLEGAKTFARISATEGGHDRAVSRGLDPKASSFEIVRRYRAGSGERVL